MPRLFFEMTNVPKTISGLIAKIARLEQELCDLHCRLQEMRKVAGKSDDSVETEWQHGTHIDSLPKQPPIRQNLQMPGMASRKERDEQ